MTCELCGKNKATICIEHDIKTDRRFKAPWKYKRTYICSECERQWEKKIKEVSRRER